MGREELSASASPTALSSQAIEPAAQSRPSGLQSTGGEFSPGPWEHVQATEHHGPYVCSVYGSTVCDLYAMTQPLFPSTASGGPCKPVPFVDAEANAALIASAPCMFSALERLSNLSPDRANADTAMDLYHTVQAIADSALARARGEVR